jgi:hypothetical protein
VTDNVWYAGEAAHETLWGTVGGAWESGERAADAVLRQIGVLRPGAQATSETDTAAQDKRKGGKRAKAERRETTRRSYESAPSYTGTPNIMGNER